MTAPLPLLHTRPIHITPSITNHFRHRRPPRMTDAAVLRVALGNRRHPLHAPLVYLIRLSEQSVRDVLGCTPFAGDAELIDLFRTASTAAVDLQAIHPLVEEGRKAIRTSGLSNLGADILYAYYSDAMRSSGSGAATPDKGSPAR